MDFGNGRPADLQKVFDRQRAEDELRRSLETARRERDEARAEAADLTAMVDSLRGDVQHEREIVEAVRGELAVERLTPEEAELVRAAREQRRTHAAYDAVRGRRTREAVALRRAAGNATLRLFNAASAIPGEVAP